MNDFEVGDDIEIVSVKTVVDKSIAKTVDDVENILITYWEKAKINYETTSKIYYKRMNHLEFKYQLNIRNPTQIRRKVIFRIWLGILADENNVKYLFL